MAPRLLLSLLAQPLVVGAIRVSLSVSGRSQVNESAAAAAAPPTHPIPPLSIAPPITPSKCCCHEAWDGPCFRGDDQDIFKAGFSFYGTDYCCKKTAGRRNPLAMHGGCTDGEFLLPLEELGPPVPFKVDGLKRGDDSEICIFKEESTTTETTTKGDVPTPITPITPSPTPTTPIDFPDLPGSDEEEEEDDEDVLEPGEESQPDPLDPMHRIDISWLFKRKKTVVNNGIEYGCCCRAEMIEDEEHSHDVACFVRNMDDEKFYWWKGGCGGLLGDGYHSYKNLNERNPLVGGTDYTRFLHAGKCWVAPQFLPDDFKQFLSVPGVLRSSIDQMNFRMALS